jgi:lipoyl(octanoyl) transferase
LVKPAGETPAGDGSAPLPPVDWRVFAAPMDYAATVAAMERAVASISRGTLAEQVWLLEHPPLYTAGTSAKPQDLVDPDRFPVFASGRGGQYTYHGPDQRVCYLMLDLDRRGRDVRAFVERLERWTIATLARFGVRGELRDGRVGVWVVRPDGKAGPGATREDKIAAIGIRVRRWVAFHGLALNVAPDLSHYGGIVPCGIDRHGVTSLADLGIDAGMAQVDAALRGEFERTFGSPAVDASGTFPC